MNEQWRSRLHRVVYNSIVRKPRTLRELVSDMPGEDWSMRDISGALLDLREAGLLRFLDGAWQSGADRGKVSMGPVLCRGHGPWDGGNFTRHHWATDADANSGGPGRPSR